MTNTDTSPSIKSPAGCKTTDRSSYTSFLYHSTLTRILAARDFEKLSALRRF